MQTVSPNPDTAKASNLNLDRVPSLSFKDCDFKRTGEVIYLVDDDTSVREALSDLLVSLGRNVVGFASAAEFLNFIRPDAPACLILNMHLPDISGLELQRRLAEKANPPVIFISGPCDIPSTVRAMKAGAIEFLTKPVDPVALIAAIRAAFALDQRLRQRKADLTRLQERFSLLTPREREVFSLIVEGLLNKQAASVLGIAEVTLQIHRSQVMRKMEAESFAELVRMAIKLHIAPWRGRQQSDGPTTRMRHPQPAGQTRSSVTMKARERPVTPMRRSITSC